MAVMGCGVVPGVIYAGLLYIKTAQAGAGVDRLPLCGGTMASHVDPDRFPRLLERWKSMGKYDSYALE